MADDLIRLLAEHAGLRSVRRAAIDRLASAEQFGDCDAIARADAEEARLVEFEFALLERIVTVEARSIIGILGKLALALDLAGLSASEHSELPWSMIASAINDLQAISQA